MNFTLDIGFHVCHSTLMNEADLTQVPELATTSAAVPGRSLHLVDVENLLGGTRFTKADVEALALLYRATAGAASDDLVVVASSHHTALPVWLGWGNARRLVRSGADGADLALLEVIEKENVAVRFERVVIGSGDGIFAFSAAALQGAGVAVTIVSQRESLSNQLRLAARDIRLLPPYSEPASAAGAA
jgi:hypothetical protein